VTTALRSLATGKLDTPIPAVDRRDEIGAIAGALQVFKENAETRARLEQRQAIEQTEKMQRQEELDQLVGLFGKSLGGVFGTISSVSTEMSQTAAHMQDASSGIDSQAGLLMRETERTSSNVQTVAASTQQLSISATEIARQVSASAQISDAAVGQAKTAVERVARLRQATELIDSILTLIRNIAEQTNLLALNATIEAARAGAAGKGFAVVANEVKSLASQTNRATGEIGDQITMIQAATAEAAEVIEAIGGTILNLHNISLGIAGAVEQQGAATHDIVRAVDEVARSTATVSDTVLQTQHSTRRGREHAVEVGQVADKLSSEAQMLSSEIKDFLDSLKSVNGTKRFRTLKVDLGCRIIDGTGEWPGRVVQISSGAVQFAGRLDAAVGTRVEIRIDGIARPIRARSAGPADGGCFLQLPMDVAHIAYMDEVISSLDQDAA
jgi:methyl-accepting chemotaxis protein